jgi:hypothetical protein
MTAGLRDLLALLLGWKSAYVERATTGPLRMVAGQTFCGGAAADGIFLPGSAVAVVSGGNTTAGQT